ncbi:MAG: hypothetical protein Q7U53_17180 [Anaerolineaceae bacterium]|nr:hypothetical protein [Anaerolineaceae bacterium]
MKVILTHELRRQLASAEGVEPLGEDCFPKDPRRVAYPPFNARYGRAYKFFVLVVEFFIIVNAKLNSEK